VNGDARESGLILEERRRAERVRVNLRVRLTNGHASFPAVTVDMSRTGVLFRVEGPLQAIDERAIGEIDPLLALTHQADEHFGRGMTVVFGGGILRRRMRVVRALPADDGTPLLACSFHRPLASHDCALLGIPLPMGSGEGWDDGVV
jgi:hypothetical protein